MQGWGLVTWQCCCGTGGFCLPAAAFLPSRVTLLIVCFPSLALQLWLYSASPFLFIPLVLQWLGSVLAFFLTECILNRMAVWADLSMIPSGPYTILFPMAHHRAGGSFGLGAVLTKLFQPLQSI